MKVATIKTPLSTLNTTNKIDSQKKGFEKKSGDFENSFDRLLKRDSFQDSFSKRSFLSKVFSLNDNSFISNPDKILNLKSSIIIFPESYTALRKKSNFTDKTNFEISNNDQN